MTIQTTPRYRKDINMKLLIIFATMLVMSRARNIEEKAITDNSVSHSSAKELKLGENLKPSTSVYLYVPRKEQQSKGALQLPPIMGIFNMVGGLSLGSLLNELPDMFNSLGTITSTVLNPGEEDNDEYQPPNSINNTPEDTQSQNMNPSQNPWNKPQTIQLILWNPPQQNWNPNQNIGNGNYWGWQNPRPTIMTSSMPDIKYYKQYYGKKGDYKYEYQISDGTHVAQEGERTNTDNESIGQKGFYSFVAKDGKTYTVRYYADDTGYHADGNHLPKAPPVPPAIQASIDYNAKKEAERIMQEQQQQLLLQQQQQKPQQ